MTMTWFRAFCGLKRQECGSPDLARLQLGSQKAAAAVVARREGTMSHLCAAGIYPVPPNEPGVAEGAVPMCLYLSPNAVMAREEEVPLQVIRG